MKYEALRLLYAALRGMAREAERLAEQARTEALIGHPVRVARVEKRRAVRVGRDVPEIMRCCGCRPHVRSEYGCECPCSCHKPAAPPAQAN